MQPALCILHCLLVVYYSAHVVSYTLHSTYSNLHVISAYVLYSTCYTYLLCYVQQVMYTWCAMIIYTTPGVCHLCPARYHMVYVEHYTNSTQETIHCMLYVT